MVDAEFSYTYEYQVGSSFLELGWETHTFTLMFLDLQLTFIFKIDFILINLE